MFSGKNQVHENERRPEVHPAPELAHYSSGHFRVPIIYTGKNCENGSRRHHVVEVSDHVVAVMQRNITKVKAERKTS